MIASRTVVLLIGGYAMQEINENNNHLFYQTNINTVKGGIVAEVGLQSWAVLTVLSAFQNKEGECYPSQSTLAELCGCNLRTVNRHIKTLCDYRTKGGKPILSKRTVQLETNKRSTVYTIHRASGLRFGAD